MCEPEQVRVGIGVSGCRGVLRAFSFSREVEFLAAPVCGAAYPSCRVRSVPESRGEEPPIRAVIRVGLGTLSGAEFGDDAADSRPVSVAIRAR